MFKKSWNEGGLPNAEVFNSIHLFVLTMDFSWEMKNTPSLNKFEKYMVQVLNVSND